MYDATPPPPLLFANHVISQFSAHLLGEDTIVEPNDFMAIRVVFRRLGGSWENLQLGDPAQMEILKNVVGAWGQMPNRKHEGDVVI